MESPILSLQPNRRSNNMKNQLARSFLAIVCLTTCESGWTATLPVIGANDNTQGAGTIAEGVLSLSLIAEKGIWYPETRENPGLEVHAFREETGLLQTPGPLVRIPEGTEIRIAIRNDIPDTTLEVHGFQSRPSNDESVLRVPSGETANVRFEAGTPGSYFY